MNVYDVGDVIRLRGSFTNSAEAAVDPTSVTLQYRRLEANVASYTTLVYGVDSVVKAGTGEYYHDAAFTQEGEWRFRWNGFGANAAAGEQALLMRTRWVG